MTVSIAMDDDIATVVVTDAGQTTRMTVAEWLDLPTPQRVNLILAGSVEFYDPQDEQIPVRQALAALRRR